MVCFYVLTHVSIQNKLSWDNIRYNVLLLLFMRHFDLLFQMLFGCVAPCSETAAVDWFVDRTSVGFATRQRFQVATLFLRG